MKFIEINSVSNEILSLALTNCCGSSSWVKKMIHSKPFKDENDLLEKAELNWFSCKKQDCLEAFSHHPKIGDIDSLKKKFQSTKIIALQEQKEVDHASSVVLKELAENNKLYEKKFGYIFIVCATGKTAEEMLSLLKERMNNNSEKEIKNAMKEQNKITQIRLKNLFITNSNF